MDKKEDKEKLVEKFFEQYIKTHDKYMWNENDMFDVACWFMGDIIVAISNANIIPREKLHTRIKNKVVEWIDDVFKQLKEREDKDNTPVLEEILEELKKQK